MTAKEFEILILKIEIKMNELDSLQKLHYAETGILFVRPCRLRLVNLYERLEEMIL